MSHIMQIFFNYSNAIHHDLDRIHNYGHMCLNYNMGSGNMQTKGINNLQKRNSAAYARVGKIDAFLFSLGRSV